MLFDWLDIFKSEQFASNFELLSSSLSDIRKVQKICGKYSTNIFDYLVFSFYNLTHLYVLNSLKIATFLMSENCVQPK